MFAISKMLSERIPTVAIVANGGMISKKEVRGRRKPVVCCVGVVWCRVGIACDVWRALLVATGNSWWGGHQVLSVTRWRLVFDASLAGAELCASQHASDCSGGQWTTGGSGMLPLDHTPVVTVRFCDSCFPPWSLLMLVNLVSRSRLRVLSGC